MSKIKATAVYLICKISLYAVNKRFNYEALKSKFIRKIYIQ